jgi:hypothetical protein
MSNFSQNQGNRGIVRRRTDHTPLKQSRRLTQPVPAIALVQARRAGLPATYPLVPCVVGGSLSRRRGGREIAEKAISGSKLASATVTKKTNPHLGPASTKRVFSWTACGSLRLVGKCVLCLPKGFLLEELPNNGSAKG